jgi:hypothetical protein
MQNQNCNNYIFTADPIAGKYYMLFRKAHVQSKIEDVKLRTADPLL